MVGAMVPPSNLPDMTTAHGLRRRHVLGLMGCAIAAPLSLAMAASDPDPVPESVIRIARSGDGFTVDFALFAPVPIALAWAVLTDFDHMTAFLPSLTSSKVLERHDQLLKVSQSGVLRYGLFSTAFDSVREVTLNAPDKIRSHGVGGSVERSDSLMLLSRDGDGTRLMYHAEVVPGSWFPPIVGPAAARHETAQQFSAMLREMYRRNGSRQS